MTSIPEKKAVRRRFYILAALQESPEGLNTTEIHEVISDIVLRLHRRTLIRDLNALEKSGHIIRQGNSSKETYWKLNTKNKLYE